MISRHSRLGVLVGILLGIGLLVVGATAARVHLVTHPTRRAQEAIDFAAMLIRVDPVAFPAVDGTRLDGWLIGGDPSRAPIILCHDLGSSKVSLINLAIALHERGFPVLVLDFRGHGDSADGASTMGLREKRDILGALDFLARREGGDLPRVGIYGVGMGAYAAVLAAADRPSLKVLVLDAIYPDVNYALSRRVFAGWGAGIRHLGFLPSGIFGLMYRTSIPDQRATDVLPRLLGRDLLFLAAARDPELTAEMKRMVRSIPDQPDVDGNLEVLPATHAQELYGEALSLHQDRVVDFFEHRLGRLEMALEQSGQRR